MDLKGYGVKPFLCQMSCHFRNKRYCILEASFREEQV